MSVMEELLKQKMLEICEICNYDWRDIKNYLISELNLSKGVDLTREKQKFLKLINARTEDVAKSDRVAEFIEKFVEE